MTTEQRYTVTFFNTDTGARVSLSVKATGEQQAIDNAAWSAELTGTGVWYPEKTVCLDAAE
jgi:hypothetical protein